MLLQFSSMFNVYKLLTGVGSVIANTDIIAFLFLKRKRKILCYIISFIFEYIPNISWSHRLANCKYLLNIDKNCHVITQQKL